MYYVAGRALRPTLRRQAMSGIKPHPYGSYRNITYFLLGSDLLQFCLNGPTTAVPMLLPAIIVLVLLVTLVATESDAPRSGED